MTFYARLAAAGLLLAALGACSPEAEKKAAAPAPSPAPAAVVQANTYAFRIGQWEAVALKDGTLNLPAGNTEASPWANTAEVSALLKASGVTDDTVHLSIQPLLVKDGDRVVLIDTGAGGQMGTEGQLQASLREAGVTPTQVTDILISHAHGDHVGGLVVNGALVFPNATIRLSIPEWTALQSDADMADLVRAITPKVQAFAPGSVVAPNITAVSLDGHTPGHSGYEIAQGGGRLLYIGDALHSSILSVQRPDWKNNWDADSATAIATRQGLLERGASQNLRIYGVHFPFPGLGRFQRRDDGFVWAPEAN
ncbi:MBL fold metallo-hydrolase [Brevundimonas sp.]|uniref:MBL fold metallo-hydrolase n=1 Tax=Brevundimonas sp. TaxID=1871086 RepID=UPI0025C3DBBF|nr:MBL fold metallo-hydrolase [Brevundimonas sp.]